MNPNWVRTIVASCLLAFVLNEAWEVPYSSTLLAIGIIFVMYVVAGQMEAGITNAMRWLEHAGKIGMGLTIFLALRFLVWDVLNLSPVQAYQMVKDAGGITHMMPNQGMPRRVLWEILFAMSAGGLAVAYAQNKGRTIVKTVFGISLLILSLQLGFPSYAKTWPNREAVSTNLVHHGVVGTAAIGTWRLAFGTPDEAQSTPAPAMAQPGKVEKALVLTYEGTTPCSTFVGWDYKVRTDGHPLRIKYNGCDWFDQPAEGNFDAPKTFEPGEAKFVSPDSLNPEIKVQVYKIVQVQVR